MALNGLNIKHILIMEVNGYNLTFFNKYCIIYNRNKIGGMFYETN